MSELLRVTRAGGFTRVTLARPQVRNAFNAALIAEMRDAFQSLVSERADALRGVILAGDGSAFCAGADADWMRGAIGLSVKDNERDAAAMQAMFTAIEACPVPVIARVQGAALGGGLGLCAVSDIVVATADATFGFTETRLGIIPAVISTFVLPKIGESHARALFLSGQRFDADRARLIGLVHEVVAGESELDARIAELIEEVRAAGPMAARGAKALIRDLRERPPDDARAETVRRIAELRSSPEGQEGLTSFVEKRRPAWADPSER